MLQYMQINEEYWYLLMILKRTWHYFFTVQDKNQVYLYQNIKLINPVLKQKPVDIFFPKPNLHL